MRWDLIVEVGPCLAAGVTPVADVRGGRALLSHLEFRKVSSLQFFRFSVSALSAAVTSAAVFGQCFLRKHYVVGCR